MPAPIRFEVFPAIDVAGGSVARLQGRSVVPVSSSLADRSASGSGDPVEVARRLAGSGARWIHLVDLDAVLHGRPGNLDVLRQVAGLDVRVQAGGGLTPEAVRLALEAGASRAILGASILGDLDRLRATIAAHGDRVGVAVDVRGGLIAPRGSAEPGPMLDRILPDLAGMRPAFVVYTDVERDGAARGPDLDGLRRIREALGVPVVASGGVRSLADLRELAGLTPAPAGAIVGRALHEGAFTMEEALAVVG